ncbi:MAG: electron transfer flavoprotein subunit alpha/FixB family protein [Propionibacteriaceae bacterium]|nr:electron transfer flavoprotein subunit alpha/FixB family protein [Propionibacteriaceae bacterium]
MPTYVLIAGTPAVADLVAMAVSLDRGVVAVVVGDESLARAASVPGVDTVIWLQASADAALEAYAGSVADLVTDPGVVLAGRNPWERVLLGAVAARLDAPVLTGATRVVAEGAATVVTHGVYGGIAQATVAVEGPVALVLDGGAALAGGGTAPVETATAAPTGITQASLTPHQAPAADLAGAARVVGVGRGLRSADDLPLVQALATALGAELACSRPVAEGLEWLPKDRYVGISGQHIAPDLYVMVGISGQIQHMGGCSGARVVVSVNSDKDAPVVAQSDLVLTGDLYTLVPAITEALERSGHGQ